LRQARSDDGGSAEHADAGVLVTSLRQARNDDGGSAEHAGASVLMASLRRARSDGGGSSVRLGAGVVVALQRKQRAAASQHEITRGQFETRIHRMQRNCEDLQARLDKLSKVAEVEPHLREMFDHAVASLSSIDRVFLENYLRRIARSNVPVSEPIAKLAMHYADVLGFQEYLPLARILKWPLKTWVRERRKRARHLFELRSHMHGVLDVVAASMVDSTKLSSVFQNEERGTSAASAPPPLKPTYFAVECSDEGRVVSKVEHLPLRNSKGSLIGESFPACGTWAMHACPALSFWHPH
jgi:hypothetical protein